MTAAEELTKLYKTAQKKLVEMISRKASNGFPAAFERQILKQVTNELKGLKKATPGLVRQMVLDGYKTGLESAVEDILRAESVTPKAYSVFSRIHTEQINLIIQNTVDELTKAVNLVGRRIEDELREAGLRATALKTATGSTVREMQKDLQKRLLGLDLKQQNGRMGVKYKNGKVVSIDHYAEMVARTTPAEAQNKAKLVQGDAWGFDLAQLTSYYPTCELCSKYQTRTFALTKEAANGKYKGPGGEGLCFPMLYETALVHGYETLHPNCRHRVVLIVARAYSPAKLKAMSEASMQPFQDTRDEEERKLYAAGQAKKRARNADNREWNKYKAALPDQAPKTFSGFLSMKRSRSKRYLKMMEDYRTMMKQENKT